MLRYTLYTLLIIICNSLSISRAQVINNHPLLPKLEECGQLKLEEFEDRTGTVQANEFPWMAQIAYINPSTNLTSYRCLAVLITQRYLLTVAHCVENSGQQEAYAVLLGAGSSLNISDEAKASQHIAIEEIIVHSYLNSRKRKNDIALIRLKEAINSFTNNIRPICLPGPSVKEKEFGAEQLIVAGFYRKGEDLWNMHKLPVVLSNVLDCRRKYTNLVDINDMYLCGITCFKGSQYMSSSALMDIIGKDNYYLAGLLSGGRAVCSYPEEPDIFVRVDRYMDWITDNIYA